MDFDFVNYSRRSLLLFVMVANIIGGKHHWVGGNRRRPVCGLSGDRVGGGMNLETVNELIASLESAGELSIKETKVMALAKAFKQLAAENVALKAAFHPSDIPSEWTDVFGDTAVIEHDAAGDNQGHSISWSWVDNQEEVIKSVLLAVDKGIETPATDRIVAWIKADAAAEREKTITFTAAKKRTQDGVALIAIGKPYKIHNDDVIGEFFIGERGRYGVITMDRLNYFATSDEYAWAFSLSEGAGK